MAQTPVARIGYRYLVFGLVELIASWVIGNAAFASNGIDNLFDGVWFPVAGRIDERLADSLKHSQYCRWRGRLRIVSALIAIPFITTVLFIERNQNQAGFWQMITGLIIGAIGIGLALTGRHELHEHGDHHHGGFSTHLLQDLAGAVIAMVSGLVAWATGVATWNLIGGFVILAFATAAGITQTYRVIREISHPEEHHPHETESAADHARHSSSNQ